VSTPTCGTTAVLIATRAALSEALTRFYMAVTIGGEEYFAALPVRAEQLNRWHRVLELAAMDVAGADVTPTPAAPAPTT
jgi:hypothetical protein